MGRSRRPRPDKLAEKLLSIRMRLGLTQLQLIEKLNLKDTVLYPTNISAYERGLREPSLYVVLRYAKLYGCTVEELVDDQLKLSTKAPVKSNARNQP